MKKLIEIIGAAISILLILIAPLLYLYALWMDMKHDNFGMFAADLIVPPIGVIHGFILFLWG